MLRCTYCGEPADTRDHVIPSTTRGCVLNGKEHTVACCKECNSVLSSRPYYTIGARAAYLEEAYRKRYKKVLKYPTWEEDEIKELSRNLQRHIQQGQWLKTNTEARLEHLEYVRIVSPSIKEVNDIEKDTEETPTLP